MPLSVVCPATTANLGPGFDALGLALDVYNVFQVEPAAGFELSASGPGAGEAAAGGAENLFVRACQAARQALGLPPLEGLRVQMRVEAPPGRGLGSSATAIVGGLLAAESLAGRQLDRARRLELIVSLEGHPDNVVPCLLGGLCLSAGEAGRLTAERLPMPNPPALVIAIPQELELSTAAMRQALPAQVPFADAVHNGARAALLVAALTTGRRELLAEALQDRLHEPYRGPRIPGFAEVRRAAAAAGAYGTVISGSGPTLLSLAPPGTGEEVGDAMAAAWAQAGVAARVRLARVETEGARVNPGAPTP